ncbi:MAG: DUF4326 domain-containing protein [Candidatus Paceibacterota bacterium]
MENLEWLIAPPASLIRYSYLTINITKDKEFDIYIGRNSRARKDTGWGNPYKMIGNSQKARLTVISSYAERLFSDKLLQDKTVLLKNKTLGCYCSPKPCHGHILSAYANSNSSEREELLNWSLTLKSAVNSLPYRLLVTGSRNWNDKETIANELFKQYKVWGSPKNVVLIQGGAEGADTIAAELWRNAGLPVETYKPKWDEQGKKAGMIRNQVMVNLGADACLAFSKDNSVGTKHCATAAKKAGIPVILLSK